MRGMDILYHEDRADAEDWMQRLREALPGSQVRAWAPGAAPADYAVVWDPPQQLIDEQPRLKALFNTGAGVERLLHLRLPETLPVVRVDGQAIGDGRPGALTLAIRDWLRGAPPLRRRPGTNPPPLGRCCTAPCE